MTQPIIPVVVKNTVDIVQQFGITFKNTSEHDMEVEFSFAPFSQAINKATLIRVEADGLSNNMVQSPIKFDIDKASVFLPANQEQ